MQRDEQIEVIHAVALAAVLACVVGISRHWDHARCWLPDMPRIQFNSNAGSPTPIKNVGATSEASQQTPNEGPDWPAGDKE